MISPTGRGIRSDPEGSGEYGSPRGDRVHNGVDYECIEGQPIVAPFDMIITRIAIPKANSPMLGIAWETKKSKGKMFYFEPFDEYIGKTVFTGTEIGIAQSVSRDYGLKRMKDHIHFQVDK
jgi:hypothetical protein